MKQFETSLEGHDPGSSIFKISSPEDLEEVLTNPGDFYKETVEGMSPRPY